MNRPQFLAELSQYLTFVTPEQRERIVSFYDAMLTQAGPEGENALFKQIGTPMTVAIAVKRRIEANEPILPDEEPVPEAPTMVKYEQVVPLDTQAASEDQAAQPDSAQSEAPVSAQAEEPAQTPQADETADAQSTAAEASETPSAEEATETPSSGDATEATSAEEATEATLAEEAADTQSPADQAANEETSVETVISEELSAEDTPDLPPIKVTELSWEKPKMTFGRFLGAIGIGIVSLCIVVFFCLVTAVGGVFIYSGVEVVISAFAISGYLTDLLITLGCGAAILAAGLLVAWFAIWAAIRLITGMIRSFNKMPSTEKSGLSIAWKVFWIIFLVLIVAAIICTGVSLILGGDPAVLSKNEAVSSFIYRISPTYYIDFISSLGFLG